MTWITLLPPDLLDRLFSAPGQATEVEEAEPSSHRFPVSFDELMKLLPPIEQDVCVWYCRYGKTQPEIAELLGVSQVAISWRLRRAVLRLKAHTSPRPSAAEIRRTLEWTGSLTENDIAVAITLNDTSSKMETSRRIGINVAAVRHAMNRVLRRLDECVRCADEELGRGMKTPLELSVAPTLAEFREACLSLASWFRTMPKQILVGRKVRER